MNTEVIGTYAGAVWEALNGNGTLNVKQLKKGTKLKEKEVFADLGWVAREARVEIAAKAAEEKELDVTLL